MIMLGLTSIGALVWAIQMGQFRSIEAGAESIFDADEPVGSVTDRFPASSRSNNTSDNNKVGNQ